MNITEKLKKVKIEYELNTPNTVLEAIQIEKHEKNCQRR